MQRADTGSAEISQSLDRSAVSSFFRAWRREELMENARVRREEYAEPQAALHAGRGDEQGISPPKLGKE
jgi:hypothetical protein